MNALVKPDLTALVTMPLTEAELLSVLGSSLYPGAAPASIKMVLGYCKAANLDPMQKPVHIVPMWDSKAKQMRDVVMPGVGLYRTQASRTGRFAGQTVPEFGPMVTEVLGGQKITYPEWAKVTVKKILDNGTVAEFEAQEFWIENYAVKGGQEKSIAPNAMWTKRPRGQIGKCAAAQALRLAFPENGAQPTAEEMEGKSIGPEEMPPSFDYLDPTIFIDGVADLQTDQEAAAYWKEHAQKLTKQPDDYQQLKDAVIARRKAIAAAASTAPAAAKPEAATEPEAKADKPAAATAAGGPEPKTYAQVMDALVKARTPDALDVAAGLIALVVSEEHRTELGAKYEELKKGMEL